MAYLLARSRLIVPPVLALLLPLLACSDDTASSEGATASSSSGTETTGVPNGTGTETGTETETETDTETEAGAEGTGGEEPACDGTDPIVGSWTLDLDGDFPDDLPNDAEASCAIVESGPSTLSVVCPEFSFGVEITAAPAPMLPAPSSEAIVRVHHEPGWLNWPDLWIDVEVAGVGHWSFQSSSVLIPKQGAYAVPWSPVQIEEECGPFLLEELIGPDGCGEQIGMALGFEVDEAPVVGWHATHVELEIDARAFELWIGAARRYLDPPEFCDVSPNWYSLITRRELAAP